MAIKTASKAIAGAVVGVGAAWLAALTGFNVPENVTEWAQAGLGTAIAAGLGYLIVWISPKNDE